MTAPASVGAVAMPEGDPMTTARYELKITAEGELRDSAGRLLDTDGNPVEPDVPEENEPEPEEAS